MFDKSCHVYHSIIFEGGYICFTFYHFSNHFSSLRKISNHPSQPLSIRYSNFFFFASILAFLNFSLQSRLCSIRVCADHAPNHCYTINFLSWQPRHHLFTTRAYFALISTLTLPSLVTLLPHPLIHHAFEPETSPVTNLLTDHSCKFQKLHRKGFGWYIHIAKARCTLLRSKPNMVLLCIGAEIAFSWFSLLAPATRQLWEPFLATKI